MRPARALEQHRLGAALGAVGGELAGAEGGGGDGLEQGEALGRGVGAQVGGDVEAAQAGAALGRGADAELAENLAETLQRCGDLGCGEQGPGASTALGEDEARVGEPADAVAGERLGQKPGAAARLGGEGLEGAGERRARRLRTSTATRCRCQRR